MYSPNCKFPAFLRHTPKAESRRHRHVARRAPTLSAVGSTFYPASVFLQSELPQTPPPPLEGPDLYGTTAGGAGGAASTVVPPYSPPVFPVELQRGAEQGLV